MDQGHQVPDPRHPWQIRAEVTAGRTELGRACAYLLTSAVAELGTPADSPARTLPERGWRPGRGGWLDVASSGEELERVRRRLRHLAAAPVCSPPGGSAGDDEKENRGARERRREGPGAGGKEVERGERGGGGGGDGLDLLGFGVRLPLNSLWSAG